LAPASSSASPAFVTASLATSLSSRCLSSAIAAAKGQSCSSQSVRKIDLCTDGVCQVRHDEDVLDVIVAVTRSVSVSGFGIFNLQISLDVRRIHFGS
jgi:hypothetical protein